MDGTRGAGLRNEALTAVAVLAAVAVAVLSAIPGAATLSLAAQSAAALGAGVAGAVTARHSTGSARWAWRFIAAGACSWGAANVIWALTGEAQGGSALASLADLGFVALFPLAFVGLMFHPAAPRGTAGLTRLALDGLIAAGSLRLVAWLLFLEDAHDGSVGHQFQDAVGFAQAVGDFGLVTVAVLVAAGARRGRRTPLLLLAAGFAAVGVADGIFTFAVLDGTYASGDPVDLLWIGGFTAIAAGARYEAVAPAAVHANAEAVDGNAATLLVPYLLVVPAFVLAVPRLLGDAPLDRGLVWNGVGVASLMLARQLADRLDNVRLVHSLRTTVTELRRRDDQLAEAQAISRLGSWEWDVDAGTIVRTDEAVRVFGLEPGSLHPGGDGLLPHVHPDDRDRVRRSVLRSIETGEPFRVDFRVTAVDGRIVHGRGRVVHDDSGRAVRMVGTVQDVTTVRRLARELEQRLAELERSNRDLAHFAAVASHDLAAPVQLLLGHLRLLSTRVRERGERTDAEMIEGAIRGAQRLEELIQDILAYSLASGGDESLRTRVDTARVARDAARAVGSDGWAASVEISDMPTVDAHPGQVRQLFSNLLSNAFKFVPAGRPPRIRVWADRVDGVWRFSVADNGTGVPDRERERIFQMFQRGAGADVSGAGIGLAICARIVARHGGRIWCAPNPEGGSIFSFTLAEGATALFADDLVEVTGA